MSTDLLTHAEAAQLAEHEQVIERGLKTFIEVGTALADIRESRLYRATHQTFEAYLEERWQISRSYAHRMITAANVVLPIGNTGLPMPANEGQARALASVPEPERADVWRDAVDRTGGKPTAAAVKQAAEQRDARALLRRALDLIAPANAEPGFATDWAKRLGSYDAELAELTKRATFALGVLDDLIEATGE